MQLAINSIGFRSAKYRTPSWSGAAHSRCVRYLTNGAPM